jgi:hypothetical protein
MPAIAITATTLVLGAALGFVPTYLIERTKQRAQLSTRWDVELYQLCAEFAGVGRQMMHATGRLGGQPGERLGSAAAASDQATQLQLIDDLHVRMRSLREQIRLIGSLEVQESARRIQGHSFWMRVVAEGGLDAGEETEAVPSQRIMDELPRFYRAVRIQLRVPAAEQVDRIPFGFASNRASD